MRSENRRRGSPIKLIFWGTVGGVIAGISVLYFASKRQSRKPEQTPLLEAMEDGGALAVVRQAPRLEPEHQENDAFKVESRDGNSLISQNETTYGEFAAGRSRRAAPPKDDEFLLSEPKTRHERVSFEDSLASSRLSALKSASSDLPVSLKFASNKNRIQEDVAKLSIDTAKDFDDRSEDELLYDFAEIEGETILASKIATVEPLNEESLYAWLDDTPTEKISGLHPVAIAHFTPTGLQDQDISSCLKEGRGLCDSHKFLEAERIYQKMQQSYPEDARLFNALGTLYAEQGKYGDAEKSWLRAISLEPSTETYNFLGSIWEGQDRYDDAVEAYQKALELNPQDIMSRSNLGWIFASQKKYSRARKEFQRTSEARSIDNPREVRSGNKRA